MKIKEIRISLLDLKQQIQLLKDSELIPMSHEGANCQYLFAVRDCDGNVMQDEEGRTRWVTRQKALDAIKSELLTIKPWHKLI